MFLTCWLLVVRFCPIASVLDGNVAYSAADCTGFGSTSAARMTFRKGSSGKLIENLLQGSKSVEDISVLYTHSGGSTRGKNEILWFIEIKQVEHSQSRRGRSQAFSKILEL